MSYFSHTLLNGLRIIHLPINSAAAYCGFAINAGARDELPSQHGLAHFVEHMLFKGTIKRKAWHILNRMDSVGGELNAYTSKEETMVYSVFLRENYERAVELLTDLITNSTFPINEIKKEKKVIIEELQSYEDSPSELIFDDFENLVFHGNPLGHNILGNEKSLYSFTSESGLSFMKKFYAAENMVFFSMGNINIKKIKRIADKYLINIPKNRLTNLRIKPEISGTHHLLKKKSTHQSHVIIGTKAYDIYDDKRISLFLINNLLGGPGMNSRLNIVLREKNGFVYNVESNITSYTDTGLFTIYFGTDKKNREKTYGLVKRELASLREKPLSDKQFSAIKKQAIGQIVLSSENKEGLFLGLGKSYLHYNKYDTLSEIFNKIESVSIKQIQEVANEIFNPDTLCSLSYE